MRRCSGETDLRNTKYIHRSPDVANNTVKSPMMINGRLESFSSVSSMVIQWEKEEESLLGMVEPGGREPRRRSHGIHELCSQFEPKEEGPDTRLKIDAEGMGVGGDIFSEGGTEMTETKINRRIFGMDGRLVERNMQPTDARLMPVESGESCQH